MRIWQIALYLCVVCSVPWAATDAAAQPEWIVAQPSDEIRFTDLSLGSLLDGGDGFGLSPGIHLGVPLLNGGVIPPINDSLYLEAGLYVSARFHRHADNYVWAVPEIGPRWNFHLTPTWDAYATLKFGWAIGEHGDFWLRSGVGTLWWFADAWGLRGEIGYGALVGTAAYLGLSYRFM
jgi:hypothetical protein